MSGQMEALIVVVTWGILLILYVLSRYLLKDSLVRYSTQILLLSRPNQANKPGTLLSKTGVLFVFMVNIITFFIMFAAALTPAIDPNLAWIKLDLPLWINILGSILFLIDYIWGLFALIFNPNYTPLYKSPPSHLILATRGPYGIIRHPRYASEAFLNIALFLFTGIWLPLLGLIGWIAIYSQACAEEGYLMEVAPDEYGEYRKKTGMFFPKLTK
jgi:protein-S-isoprenylcysteine O-methyltransferase Ste14